MRRVSGTVRYHVTSRELVAMSIESRFVSQKLGEVSWKKENKTFVLSRFHDFENPERLSTTVALSVTLLKDPRRDSKPRQ